MGFLMVDGHGHGLMERETLGTWFDLWPLEALYQRLNISPIGPMSPFRA
jgi:hypothetical protein